MADTTQIKNPSLLPEDLNIKLSGDAITAISGHPLIGTGGGTQSDWVYVPSFNTETGKVLFELGTTADNPQPEGGWYISGAQGPQGEQGEQGIQGETGPAGANGSNGTDGKTPELRINPSNAEWQWKYTVDNDWINLGVTASGASGASGYSPTVELTEIVDPEYPQGGWNVTITDEDHQSGQTFQIFNGIDGQGATVDLIGGTGIQVSHQTGTTDYTISVSADYALKSYVDSASANALNEAETWVENKHYLTEIPTDYAKKTDIPTTVAQLTDSGNYYKTTETSGANELATEFANKVNKPDASLTDKYLLLRTDTNGAVSGWCDFNDKIYSKTESDGRYMQKNTDSTLSGDGATNNPLGIDTTNMVANKQYAFTTTGWGEVSVPTIPDITANTGLSANGHTIGIDNTNLVANTQYAWTTTGWQLISIPAIPDITANNGLSANGHTVGISNNNIVANKQYAWTTTGWSDIGLSAYLPLSGGTVSGQLTVSGSEFANNLHLKRGNNEGFIGLAGNGAITFKNVISNSTSQIEFLTSANKTFDITIKDNSTTPQPVGKLYVMSAHSLADAAATSANWANDGMLHIILES